MAIDYDVTGVSSRATSDELKGRPAEPLPTRARLEQLMRQFREWPERQAWLDSRGLSRKAARQALLGFYDGKPHGRTITIPLIDSGGPYNLKRRYLDIDDPSKKYRGLRGQRHGLYPGAPRTGEVVLCEGEFDTMLLRQHGFDAVCPTAGMGHWEDDWSDEFAGRDVAVLFDAGGPAFEYAEQRVEQLDAAGACAWALDLTLAGMKPGEDATDWFVKYGWTADDLRAFIEDQWEHR